MKIWLSVAVISIVLGSQANAQEWSLNVRYIINNNPTPVRTVTFGYDAAASDSMVDNQWSESPLPSLGFPGDPDLRMISRVLGRNYLESEGNHGGLIDIRKKPSLDSFTLGFELSLALPDLANTAYLEWDKSSIPPIIKHIYMSSEAGSLEKYQKDMVVDSRLDIPTAGDSLHYFDNILIRVLYNTFVLDVFNRTEQGISSIYPSAAMHDSKRYFNCDKEMTLRLTLTDMLGRKIAQAEAGVHKGINEVPQQLLGAALPGPGMYIIAISDLSGNSTAAMQKIVIE